MKVLNVTFSIPVTTTRSGNSMDMKQIFGDYLSVVIIADCILDQYIRFAKPSLLGGFKWFRVRR